jgi:hypothetical protein
MLPKARGKPINAESFMLGRVGLVVVVTMAAPSMAEAGVVVVFPLDGRNVLPEVADSATEIVKRTIRSIAGMEVIESATVEHELGVRLTEQAQKCEYDVFCLVQLGEVFQSERMLVGHVRRVEKSSFPRPIHEGGGSGSRRERAKAPEEEYFELKLFVLDVAKASVADVLVWRVRAAIGDAVEAAARRLFSPPNVELLFEVAPPHAEVSFYGDPVSRPKSGALPFWSGSYFVRIRADGFVPFESQIRIPEGAPTTLSVQLQPDLRYVSPSKTSRTVNPFGTSSRREGGRASPQEAGAKVDVEDPASSPFANPLAWTAAGAGLVAVVIGGVIANGAQSSYNALSGERRYSPEVTHTAGEAANEREDARSRYRAG